jgi:hypothetical protein
LFRDKNHNLFDLKTHKFDSSISPSRDTYEYHHIDDGSQAHRKRAQEQRLLRVSDHDLPYFWKHCIPDNGNKCESDEQYHVQTEDHDGNPIQPVAIVWEIMEKDGDLDMLVGCLKVVFEKLIYLFLSPL